MKKKILLTLPLLLMVVGCADGDDLTILCPTGAPAIAFYDHVDDVEFQTNSTPANIVSQMTSNGSDVIVIDTVSGVKAIASGAPYKLAANITFGNFYIASTGLDDNNTMDKDDSIVIFGQSQTPDKIFTYLYGSDYTNITFVDNVQSAAKCLISKKTLDNKDVKYVFVAEPVLTNALKQNSDASIYANIQDVYKEKTSNELIQAGVFIKNSVANSARKDFLRDLKEDINDLLNNSQRIYEGHDDVTPEMFTNKIGIPTETIIECLNKNNSIGLGYKEASDNFNSIKGFLELFNQDITKDEIY